MFDEDIKIASLTGGKKPHDVTGNDSGSSVPEEYTRESSMGNTEKARVFGKAMAESVVSNLNIFATENEACGNGDMATQRGILMTFAATAAVEGTVKSSVVAQSAKNSFYSELERLSPVLYKSVSDSGAFSFYYLAYRRGSEVDRRIGQTFAMLCSHDGDPVYQELGEAIYCWFLSETERKLRSSGLLK